MIPVYTSPTSINERFLESLGQALPNPTVLRLISGVISIRHSKIGLTMPSQIPRDLNTSVITF